MTRDELVLANLSLARRAAHDFQRKRFCCIGDGDDYFQAAVAGMILAADTYDPTVGEFSTWAYFKMRREMQRVFADVEPVLSTPDVFNGYKGTDASREYDRAIRKLDRPELKPHHCPDDGDDLVDVRLDVAEALSLLEPQCLTSALYCFGFKPGTLRDAAREIGVSKSTASNRKEAAVPVLRAALRSYDVEAA